MKNNFLVVFHGYQAPQPFTKIRKMSNLPCTSTTSLGGTRRTNRIVVNQNLREKAEAQMMAINMRTAEGNREERRAKYLKARGK